MSHEIVINRIGHIFEVNNENKGSFREVVDYIKNFFQEENPYECEKEQEYSSGYEVGKEEGIEEGYDNGHADCKANVIELLEQADIDLSETLEQIKGL